MTDVDNNGHTAYPMLDIISPAKKGTVVMWYNFHINNRSIIDESIHGSCPILKGNKWSKYN